jgi:hypothetical protein
MKNNHPAGGKLQGPWRPTWPEAIDPTAPPTAPRVSSADRRKAAKASSSPPQRKIRERFINHDPPIIYIYIYMIMYIYICMIMYIYMILYVKAVVVGGGSYVNW